VLNTLVVLTNRLTDKTKNVTGVLATNSQ